MELTVLFLNQHVLCVCLCIFVYVTLFCCWSSTKSRKCRL